MPTSVPISIASSRDCSRIACRRAASLSISWSPPSTLTEIIAMLVMMPMMMMTTSTSSSVKPEAAAAAGRRRDVLIVVPVAVVGIGALATRLAIGAEGEEVVVAVRARRDVLVVVAPRILAQVLDVAALLPVLDVGVGRLLHERLEALLGRRIAEVVHAVQIERSFVRAYVLLRLGD